MRLCEQVDEWFVFENHAEWRTCLFVFVPRLTPVERPSSLLWSVALRAVARVALFCAHRALFFPSCLVTSLCDSSDDFSSMARGSRKHCSYHVITIHLITHGGGAVVLIRMAWRKSFGRSGRMVAVSGNTLVDGRPREHNGNSTEFKFVFTSFSGVLARTTDLVTLVSSLSTMRTGTTERSAAEFWLIPVECGWVKNKNKEQGIQKDKSKGKRNENPKRGQLTELRSNCRKWGHNVPSCWHGKEKQVNRVRNKAGTASVSSSSSTLMSTDADTKELGLIESGSENAEKSWLGMVAGFVAINQFSMDSVTSVHVCPKSSATHATLSLKGWGMRGVVCNEMDLHREVCTRRPMLSVIWWEIEGFHLTVGDGCRKF